MGSQGSSGGLQCPQGCVHANISQIQAFFLLQTRWELSVTQSSVEYMEEDWIDSSITFTSHKQTHSS